MRQLNVFLLAAMVLLGVTLPVIALAQEGLPRWMQQSGWVSLKSLCESTRTIRQSEYYGANCDNPPKVSVTPKGLFPHWAGEVVEVYYDAGIRNMTGKVKVRITWKTDRSSYQCGAVVTLHRNTVKDFKFRSLQLSKC